MVNNFLNHCWSFFIFELVDKIPVKLKYFHGTFQFGFFLRITFGFPNQTSNAFSKDTI